MEKKYCPNCFSTLEENVATCPFCGVKPAEIDEGVSSLLLKANAIWGNQAVYADKIKGISAKVAMQLLQWYVDSEKYSGFAFGLGLERLTMFRFGLDDMRMLYENDIRFLEQF